jgi:hypothetical protein
VGVKVLQVVPGGPRGYEGGSVQHPLSPACVVVPVKNITVKKHTGQKNMQYDAKQNGKED